MSTPFVRVALPRPVEDTFHYEVPLELRGKVVLGSVVHVPFGRRTMTGVVVKVVEFSPVRTRKIVALHEGPPLSSELIELARWTAAYYQIPEGLLLRLALPPSEGAGSGPRFCLTDAGRKILGEGHQPFPEILEALRRGPRTSAFLTRSFESKQLEKAISEGLVAPLSARPFKSSTPGGRYQRKEAVVRNLTSFQKEALARISEGVGKQRFQVNLLRGVTGSGKTEVYLRAARFALNQGKRVLLLVPEISLTPLLVSRLQGISEDGVATLHSGMTKAERAASWQAIREGRAHLVVGVRSGVFAPVPDLGLIIVDEEHDPSFRQEDTPSYNARDVAVKRGQLENIPVVLGSATPSFESWHNATEGKYNLLILPDRVTLYPEPELFLVDMSDPGEYDLAHPFLSRTLIRELSGVIERGEQSMLFLNRRGLAPFLLCRDCRQTVLCPNCSVTLTFHANNRAICHYCGHQQISPASCPECGSSKLNAVGEGTQKIEETLQRLFPGVAVDRLDRDALGKRGSLEEIYGKMDFGKTAVLVGTQMLAKGHDFAGVTLAGILNAEQALDFPDFRSAERTYQTITQVAGRAGRGDRPGRVVIQTYTPDHYAITTALTGDQETFYRMEMESRLHLGYPPFTRLGRIIIDGVNESKVARAALTVSEVLAVSKDSRKLGPSPAPLLKIRNRYRWHLLVFSKTHGELISILQTAKSEKIPGVRVLTRVDPVQLL